MEYIIQLQISILFLSHPLVVICFPLQFSEAIAVSRIQWFEFQFKLVVTQKILFQVLLELSLENCAKAALYTQEAK